MTIANTKYAAMPMIGGSSANAAHSTAAMMNVMVGFGSPGDQRKEAGRNLLLFFLPTSVLARVLVEQVLAIAGGEGIFEFGGFCVGGCVVGGKLAWGRLLDGADGRYAAAHRADRLRCRYVD